MSSHRLRKGLSRASLFVPGAFLLFGLVAPLTALGLALTPSEVVDGLGHPLFLPALLLSAKTSLLSLALVIVAGTPLAWGLASARSRWVRGIEVVIDLPIVLPPAVLGVALLETFGRTGVFGPLLASLGLQVPFTTSAVVVAQVVVSAPFFVQSAVAAFRGVDRDLLLVARTLGQGPLGAFVRVAIPLALPGLASGAAMAWARAVGEFGATLLFAGNRAGVTQTMPLAIFTALESDVRVAIALSLVLATIALLLLLGLRLLPRARHRPARGLL